MVAKAIAGGEGPGCNPDPLHNYPAALEVEMKIKIKITPPDPARNPGFCRKTAVRTLTRDPPGEGGQEQIQKRPYMQLGLHSKPYSWCPNGRLPPANALEFGAPVARRRPPTNTQGRLCAWDGSLLFTPRHAGAQGNADP